RLRQRPESEQGIVKHLAAADRNMDVDPSAGIAQDSDDIRFENVCPERQERSCPAVHNEYGVVIQKSFRQPVVVGAHQNAILVDQIKILDGQSLILPQGSVDWIAVDATHRLPASHQELREPGGDDGFADAAFALQDQVNGGRGYALGCALGCARSRDSRFVSVSSAFCCHNVLLSSNKLPAVWIAVVVNLTDMDCVLR